MIKEYDDFLGYCYDKNIIFGENEKTKQDIMNKYDYNIMLAKFLTERERKFKKYYYEEENALAREKVYPRTSMAERKKKYFQAETRSFSEKEFYTCLIPLIRECNLQEQAELDAFDTIKDKCVELARMGQPNAISFYLAHTPPEKRLPSILAMAHEYTKKELKTAEEWEICASYDMFTTYKANGKSCSSARVALNLANLYNNISFDAIECHDEINGKEYYLKYQELLQKVYTSNYGKNTQKALLGYYGRYFNADMPYLEYIDEYMYLARENKFLLSEPRVFATVSNNTIFSLNNLKAIMKSTKVEKTKEFDPNQKIKLANAFDVIKEYLENNVIKNLPDKMAEARYLAFYSDKKSDKKKGMAKLNYIASHDYYNKEDSALKVSILDEIKDNEVTTLG